MSKKGPHDQEYNNYTLHLLLVILVAANLATAAPLRVPCKDCGGMGHGSALYRYTGPRVLGLPVYTGPRVLGLPI